MTVDIELDKDDDRILETIDNGITKVGLNAENMKDLEQKEKEYIQELRDADKAGLYMIGYGTGKIILKLPPF